MRTDHIRTVLDLVDTMTEEGYWPAPAIISLRSQPPMTTAEVMTTAGHLVQEGLLKIHEHDGMIFYTRRNDISDDTR